MVKDFVGQNLINVLSSIAIGLINWLFGFIIIRYVPEEQYTIFFTFSSLLAIASFPGAWITLMTIQVGHPFWTIIKQKLQNIPYAKIILSLVLISLAVLFILINVSVFFLGLLFMVLLFGGYYSSFLRGLLQRDLKFMNLGVIGLAEVIIKALILGGFVALGISGWGMYTAIFIQTLFTLVVLMKFVPKRDVSPTEKVFSLRKEALLALFYSSCFLLITNIDLIMAKALLPLQQNADYISLLQIGKLIIFGSSALITVLVPALQKYKDTKQQILMSMLTGAGIIVGSLIVAGFVIAEYSQVVHFLKIQGVGLDLILEMVGAVALLGLAQIPLVLLLAKRNTLLPITVIITVISQVALYLSFGKDLRSFIMIYGITAAILLIATLSAQTLFKGNKHEKIIK